MPMSAPDQQQCSRREYIRHPCDIPLVFHLDNRGNPPLRETLSNVGFGGVCFSAPVPVEPGTGLVLEIPVVCPAFKGKGVVVWCRYTGEQHYDLGVRFKDPDEQFRMRMIEQICHIEHYRRKVLREQGRELSGEEAAREWIGAYAARFPRGPENNAAPGSSFFSSTE